MTPLVITQLVGGRFEQVLVEAVQYFPVVAVQSLVPHLQSLPVLVVMPSVTTHGQVMSSLFALETYFPVGQVPHESVVENGCLSGLDMYLPLGQQPERALTVPQVVRKALPLLALDHLPPHNVRLNPLLVNTKKGERIQWDVRLKNRRTTR